MKTFIHTIQDALAFQLQGLFYSERFLARELNACMSDVGSEKLKNEMQRYARQSENKILKFERIFNYLMQEPQTRKNEVIHKMIDEMHQILGFTTPSKHLKDMLRISCIQNINAYKIAGYKNAYMFAVELELDTAADLLQQILEWELATGKALSELSIEEFNRLELKAQNY
ncbi:MAG TPA: DUF892 family protein [Chryseosolibacter sp.]